MLQQLEGRPPAPLSRPWEDEPARLARLHDEAAAEYEPAAEPDEDEPSPPSPEPASPPGRQHFFSCAKCNYVTHVRSRYTKHVKYHTMPLIKCVACDFTTPYKWNLDRHMRNHGGGGAFTCARCDFTADIKQSLTVHELNHHRARPARPARRRRPPSAAPAAPARSQSDEEELQDDFKEMSPKREENDAMEVTQDEGEINSDEQHSLSNNDSSPDSSRQCKRPRPIPQLIPLNCSTPTTGSAKTSPTEPPLKRFKDMLAGNVDLDILNYSSTDIFKADRLPEDLSATSAPTVAVANNAPRRKNESFFDKLKERLLTETSANGTLSCKVCGFLSKCLSEHSVHEKNCASSHNGFVKNASSASVSSTRCQNCRHRCKSSADLYIHMQTCKRKTPDKQVDTEIPDGVTQAEEQPHPMENVVFVWNNTAEDTKPIDFNKQLNITISDDSLTETGPRSYDPNNVDALHEAETLSPRNAAGKRVFKCPHCPFWASTASRFHVHIVGHLNKKPFECSICNYKSNWRWDITKHIKLKSVRDPEHYTATVLMTDETGRRNYSKYGKFLITLTGDQSEKSLDPATRRKMTQELTESEINASESQEAALPLDLHTASREDKTESNRKKKTLWKCKKCDYRDMSKEALLEHVKEHSRGQGQETDGHGSSHQKDDSKDIESAAVAYQCGHCNQLSNWKHVIQRHCRLKHNGDIKVLPVERAKTEPAATSQEPNTDYCNKCPFKTTDKSQLFAHMQRHVPSLLSIFKCYFCPYFVKNESELMSHLPLHGISNPEEYVAKSMGAQAHLYETPPTKRHKCTDCPYETNSKSQYMYHEQFHRLPANTPYKCQMCNYSVTKRHLLHQHVKVHGIAIKKEPADVDVRPLSPPSMDQSAITPIQDIAIKTEDDDTEIPYVWVSAKNEFHKMYKCRYCSYVNSQQCKIPNHEKIHIIMFDGDVRLYKCLECKFTCDVAARLTEHSKMHGEIYGRIYYPVDKSVSDESQIAKLRILLEQEKQALLEASLSVKTEDGIDKDVDSDKMSDINKSLYFCKKCPSRFFGEVELLSHDRFHELKFSINCKICSFTAPQECQMAAHTFVHTDEYQSKTKMLQMIHDTSVDHPQPNLACIKYSQINEQIWTVLSNNAFPLNDVSNGRKSEVKHSGKSYPCPHCPAKFFKTSALSYHTGLHGGPGSHMCKKCNYTVSNIGNLVKHESIHNKEEMTDVELKHEFDSGDDIDFKNVPLSGTDLFQRKTEAQKRHNNEKLIMRPNDHFPPVLHADPQFGYLMHGNPEFIYPTYLKNGRQKEKRYKCHKCPSAFEKREQYKVHLSLHGSKQRYKCELCDYSVKYYANYVQHMRKHQMNAEAQAERNKNTEPDSEQPSGSTEDEDGTVKLAIKSIPRQTVKSDFMQFSIGDQQTLRLLQRRRSSVGSSKEAVSTEPTPEKEVKKHACPYCPYSNQRRDALENHMKRHKCVSGVQGNHECSHCDFSCNQSHFLREHLKIHFTVHKNAGPKCFVHNEGVVLTITKIEDEEKIEVDLSISEPGNKDACSKAAEKIFIQPSTGEIVV